MDYKKAIFLDRDGTLIEDILFEYRTWNLKFLPGVFEGLKSLQNDFIFFIVTNQTGIGKGAYSYEDYNKYHSAMLEQLREQNIFIERTYCCPHLKEDNCNCRKPKTGSIEEAVLEYNIDLKNSWTIGDHPCDVELGINAGCKSIYLLTGHGEKHLKDLVREKIRPDFIANNFLGAAIIMKKH